MPTKTNALLYITLRAVPAVDQFEVFYHRTDEHDKRSIGAEAELNLSHTFGWDAAPYQKLLSELQTANPKLKAGDIVQLGEALYQCVFQPESALEHIFKQARTTSTRTRLVFNVEAESLRKLPWESLYEGSQYLSAQSETPMVHSINSAAVSTIDLKLEPVVGALRVLVVTAAPRTLTPLPTDAIVSELRGLFARRGVSLPFSRIVQPTYLEHATFAAFKTELGKLSWRRTPYYQAVCFIGHGEANCIYFETANEHETCSAVDLAALLATHHIRMICLLACKSASAEQAEQSTGVAQALVAQSKIPAVIAMRTDISTLKASVFAVDFFREVVANKQPVDVAVALARASLIRNNAAGRDTIAPVLYLTSRNADIFRAGINWVRVLAGVSAALFVAFVAFGILTVISSHRQQVQTTIDLQKKSEDTLQTLGQIARMVSLPLQGAPSLPWVENNVLWLSVSGQNVVQRFRLDGTTLGTPIAVGDAPERPFSAAGYIWISNKGGRTVTRIDPNDTTKTMLIHTDLNPERPLSLGSHVYVQSRFGWRLARIDASSGQIIGHIKLDAGAQLAFVGGGYLWVLRANSNQLLRLADAADQTEAFQFGSTIQSASYERGVLWLVVDSRILYAIDPATMQIKATLPFSTPIAFSSAGTDGFWVTEQSTSGTRHIFQIDGQIDSQINTAALRITRTFEITDGQPRTLFFTPGRLWAALDQNRLLSFDLTNSITTPFSSVPMPGAGSLSQAVSDGNYLWLIASSGIDRQVLIINENNGSLVRPLNPCDQPQALFHDGTNMWITCADHKLIYLPTTSVYLGQHAPGSSATAHPPLLFQGKLWLTQENSGQIFVYDMHYQGDSYLMPTARPVDVLNLQGPLEDLTTDSQYLWTAEDDQGRLVRLEPIVQASPLLLDWLAQIPPTFDVAQRSTTVNGKITSLYFTPEFVWVFVDVLTMNSAGTPATDPNVFVFWKSDLRQAAAFRLGAIATGFFVTGDSAWIGASGAQQGGLYQIDLKAMRNGQVPTAQHYAIPGTAYAPWSPFMRDGKLWFTFGAPPTDASANFLVGCALGKTSPSTPGVGIFDPIAGQWMAQYSTPPNPRLPTIDDPYLWYTSFCTPTLVMTNEALAANLFVMDMRSGALIMPDAPCSDPTGAMLTAHFMWLGCTANGRQLWAYDRQTLRPVRQYPQVGTRPREPVQVGSTLWFTFGDTNNAAAFDATNGDLLSIVATGKTPGPPLIYEGAAWVYNSGDNTFQRLGLPLTDRLATQPN